jgi:galactose oxidase
VLLVGGGDPPTKTAEVIDLNAGTPAWRPVASMAYKRRQLSAALLPDGTVLVTGGSSASGFDNAAGAVYAGELWNPITETWTRVASFTKYRGYHSFTLLLPDGRVLSGGGDYNRGAEVYSPGYLFKGARPVITSAPSIVTYGQPFFVRTAQAAQISRVSLLRLSSVTHAFNMEQRINRLAFSAAVDGDGLNVAGPTNANLSPPGYYMLFILKVSGVPSVAKIVRVQAAAPTPPAAPSGLTATPRSASRIDLNWTDNADTEDGFRIERCKGVTCTDFAQIAQTGPNATTYSDTGLEAVTAYSYRVWAFNGAGDSASSDTATALTLILLP